MTNIQNTAPKGKREDHPDFQRYKAAVERARKVKLPGLAVIQTGCGAVANASGALIVPPDRLAECAALIEQALAPKADAEIVRLPSQRADDLALLRQGFEPIAVLGKAAVSTGWQAGPITPERINAMREAYPLAINTGLRTGALAAVDIDVVNEDHVKRIVTLVETMLGYTLLQRFGSKGLMLCYFNSTPIRKVTVLTDAEAKVEILGHGQQFVALGTHPTTQKPFEWRGFNEDADDGVATPLNTPLAKLPQITPVQILEFAKRCAELMRDLGYSNPRVREAHSAEKKTREAEVDEDSALNVSRAKEHLENCVARGHVAVIGALGNDTIYDLACVLLDRFYLSPETTERLMLEIWYPHCTPNTLEDELRSIVAHAASYIQNEPGANASGSPAETFKVALDKLPKDEPQADNGAWPEPVDLFAEKDYKKDAKLTRDMLPDAIADFAFDAAERLGVEPSMTAVSCLAVAAASLHDDFKIQPTKFDTSYQMRACTWGMMIAAPGGKKSPAIKQTTSVLNHIEAQWREDDAKALAKHNHAHALYEVAQKANLKTKENTQIVGNKMPDVSDDEVLAEPEKPTKRHIIIDNATMEGLYAPLTANPRGMLVVKDELKEWIESFDAYSVRAGKDRAAALRLRDGGRLKITRAAGDRNFDIPNWSASVIGGIQGDVLAAMVNKLDMSSDGFLQRFQPFFGEKTYKKQDRPPNYTAKARYENMVKRLLALEVPTPPRAITLSDEARSYWDAVSSLAEQISRSDANLSALRNHAAKWEGMFTEHLLIFHAIECMDAGTERLAPEVSGETARKAYALMTGFFVPQALQFYDTFFGQGGSAYVHAQWLAGYILSYHLDPSRARGPLTEVRERDLKRAYKEVRDDPALLRNAMHLLAEADWVGDPETSPGGQGATSIRWQVNPLVHRLFKNTAAREASERMTVRDVIRAEAAKRAD